MFWIFLEYIDYIPNEKKIITEFFLDKVPISSQLPIPFIATTNNNIASINQEGSRNGITTLFKNIDNLLFNNDSILRNVRYNPDRILSNNAELNFSQMNKLTELVLAKQPKIIEDNSYGGKEILLKLDTNKDFDDNDNDNDIKDLEKSIIHLISQLNKEFIDSGFIFDKIKFNPIKEIDHKFISKRLFVTRNKIHKLYSMQVQVGRKHKTHTFMLYTDIIFIDDENVIIHKLEIIGVPIVHNNTNSAIDLESPKENRTKLDIELERNTDYKCFDPTDIINEGTLKYTDEQHCISFHPEINKIGVWDNPCKIDEECPYYKSNKNYENEFGGCGENGKCMMPVGVTTIGYKQVANGSEPLCYNCSEEMTKKGNHKCCNLQKNPDYMYPNDTNLREQNKEILERKGLKYTHSL